MPLTKLHHHTSQRAEVPLPPKALTSPDDHAMARRIRDAHWHFMQRVADLGTCWLCCWNQHGFSEGPDEYRTPLLSGMPLSAWMHTHPEWWDIGVWDDTRHAQTVRLTDAGREALAHRGQYDMEPVTGGLVEPGWVCTPTEEYAS